MSENREVMSGSTAAGQRHDDAGWQDSLAGTALQGYYMLVEPQISQYAEVKFSDVHAARWRCDAE